MMYESTFTTYEFDTTRIPYVPVRYNHTITLPSILLRGKQEQMAMPTARITAQHLQTSSFQGQLVRAVGKLIDEGDNYVTLQLAGEGEPLWTSCGESFVIT